jgi:uncharacterized protein YbbK (DUF523 family)
MIGVSSCLAGMDCTFRGKNHLITTIKEMVDNKEAILICPEVLAGMSIPRDPCEIKGDKVISNTGEDHTKEYYDGAYKALQILQEHNIEVVLLKAKSPSCGKGKIYDGTFQHVLVDGNGITVKVLEENGIIAYNEDTITEFYNYIGKR